MIKRVALSLGLVATLAVACGTSVGAGGPDLGGSPGEDAAAPARDRGFLGDDEPRGDAAAVPDASVGVKDAGVDVVVVDAGEDGGPTAAQCLEDWASYGGSCAAPVITESYVGENCVGSMGWFIEGQNFQLEKRNDGGVADYGPRAFGVHDNVILKSWNVITATLLCMTVGFKYDWVGKTIYVTNPDGKSSNSVVVVDKL